MLSVATDLEPNADDAIQLFSTSTALFVENQGQWSDETVRYGFNGDGVNIAFTDDGLAFQLSQREAVEGTVNQPDRSPENLDVELHDRFDSPEDYVTRSTQFTVQFDGANAVTPVGLDQAETRFNYFVGDTATHRSNVPGYATVAYENLYDGIDLHTFGRRDSLKYEFYVAPGADYRQIEVSYDGIDGLWIDDDGALHVDTDLGELADDAPYIYQTIDGEDAEVAGRFSLVDGDTYSFEITGAYDPNVELVIDPNLAWATYLGGSSDDYGYGIAVDANGNALVTGVTWSTNFARANNSPHGSGDAFVAKVTSGGTLEPATCLGGNGDDSGFDIAVDASGNAMVTGSTNSTNFARANNSPHGGGDAFVAKLTGAGTPGATVTTTHEGRRVSSWDSNHNEFEPSETFGSGIQLGANVFFNQQQSVPTYSFAIPNPSISSDIFLSSLTIFVTGSSNAPGAGSGVTVSVGGDTWELPGDPDGQTTPYTFTGGSGTDWANIIQSRNDGWFVDVTLAAIEDDDWYDLRDVTVTTTYTGITPDNLARLDQIARGVAQLDRFNTFHQNYLHDGNAVLREAYNAFWAEPASALAGMNMGVAVAPFGEAWSAFASGAFALYIGPKISAVLDWPSLTSALAYGDWYFGNVIQGNTWTRVNTLHGTLNTARNALRDLGNVYYGALQDDGVITPTETFAIDNEIADADAALELLRIAANSMASALVVTTYNGTSEPYREDAGKAIDGYMAALSLLYDYDYTLGSSTAPNASESYLYGYRDLLNQQIYDAPIRPTADAGGPYSGNEGSGIALSASGSSDLDDFILGLNNAAQYEAVYGVPPTLAGDTDHDGDLDFDDIDVFVDLLTAAVLAQRATLDGQVAAVVAVTGGTDAMSVGGCLAVGMDRQRTTGRSADRPLARSDHGASSAHAHHHLVDHVWRDNARVRPARPHGPMRTHWSGPTFHRATTDGLLAAVWSGDDDWISAGKLGELG